jgi:perosamine synthetase
MVIPYARHDIDDDDIAAVTAALRSGWLTTGPLIDEFERAVAQFTGARHAVAVSSGTAALHAVMDALGIGPGDEVIVPTITFAATANAAAYVGATPVFADVAADSLLIDPQAVAAKLGPRTRAIVAVDYAGHPADYAALEALAKPHGVAVLADACHALGAGANGRPAGGMALATAFSFHPVKHITTGEGGMVVSDDPMIAARARRFRGHGIDSDHRERAKRGTHAYDMVELGYNYRLSDIQCALGLSQLRKLPEWLRRRRSLAAFYDALLADIPEIKPLVCRPGVEHAYHLYVVALDKKIDRDGIYRYLNRRGIHTNVHYRPVHLHPYYQRQFATGPGQCPVAEAMYPRILSLPMFATMREDEVRVVIDGLKDGLRQAAPSRVSVSLPR